MVERLTAAGKTVGEDGRERPLFPLAITPGEGDALRELVERERAVNTIEIGLAHAFATLHIVEGMIRAVASGPPRAIGHTAIDPFQASAFANTGRLHLAEAGVANLVELWEEESQVALPRMVAEGRAFDFVPVEGGYEDFVDFAAGETDP